jgi:pyrimidine deaminase RibD-like protein
MRAIKLAEESKQNFEDKSGTHPAVGCVILDKNGRIIVQAFRNEDAGKGKNGSHAEVNALRKLRKKGEMLKMHALISTLEPCSFRRCKDNISCARRVVRSGVKRVIIGSLDPGIGVRGRGAQLLQTRGIHFSMFPEELNHLVIAFNQNYLNMQETTFDKGSTSVRQDLLKMFASFDLNDAPPQSLNFLRSNKFLKFARELYAEFLANLGGNKKERWAVYFLEYGPKSRILEKEKINTEEGNVFEQIATFLGLPPSSTDQNANVYSKVGEWFYDNYVN